MAVVTVPREGNHRNRSQGREERETFQFILFYAFFFFLKPCMFMTGRKEGRKKEKEGRGR